jgi:membrane protein DedA with SNARE-associated domain
MHHCQDMQARTRWLNGRRLIVILAVLAVLVSLLAGFVLWRESNHSFRELAQRHGPLISYLLLYIEESGIPLPVPGDVFVMYVGHSFRDSAALLVLGWLGLVVCVVLGSTNLYLIAREWGRWLVTGRVGAIIHLTPKRLETAENWFRRWGPLAIIFGRHIPGFRVPITVACGIFRVSYPVFATCVAISTGIWAGIFVVVGVYLGTRVQTFLAEHRVTYITIPLIVGLAVAYFLFRLLTWESEKEAAPEGRLSG